MTKSKTAVAVIDPQVAAIATMTEQGDIEGLKSSRAMAAGLQKAAKARGLGIADENKAAELVLRAERGIGVVLIDMAEKGLRAPAHSGMKYREQYRDETALPTLAELLPEYGNPNNAAAKFQALARLPEDKFEGMLSSIKGKTERIAKVDFYRGAVPKERDYAKEQYREPTEPVLGFLSKAAEAVEGGAFSRLPAEDLVQAKDLIQALVSGFATEKARRAAG